MDLYSQAAQLNIQTSFIDGQGHSRVTDPDALKIILDALPEPPHHALLTGTAIIRDQRAPRLQVKDADGTATWTIAAGDVVVSQGVVLDRSPELPAGLPSGVYDLSVTDASRQDRMPLIVAPERAFAGEFERCWLLAVQLYSVRSARNWGIGDFSDLGSLIDMFAGLGAGGIGLNPLHALFDDRPGDCSPYSPNSRLFLNPLYIDPAKVPGYAPGAEPGAAGNSDVLIDYPEVARRKWQALRAAFANFKAQPDHPDRPLLDAFRGERGLTLARFASFEALRHEFGTPWWEWPDEWRTPDDERCAKMRDGKQADDIAFVEFVQWCADRQLQECQQLATRLGMPVGLYLDVAVGVQADGFDAWNEQAAISRRLSVGAPPDPLNTAGQNWGLAGFNASGLEACAYRPFREMLRHAMRHAGAIRLDHVLGLNRLYLVPHGFAADNGVYVKMPFEALLAVTALESVANRCVVIGEDLGTVPDGFRETISDWGVWSYLVMMFERDHEGRFRGPDHYMANALVTLNTHDLATYAGWRSLSDLTLKRSLGIDPGESDETRRHAIAMLDEVLRHHGINDHSVYAANAFLARTRSRLLTISLEDLLGVLDQPNIPGTVNEHPNWRRRLPVAIERMASEIDVDALRQAMRDRVDHREKSKPE